MADDDKLSSLSNRILRLAHDDLLVHLRFLDTALVCLQWRERRGLGGMATDGEACWYDPVWVLETYREDSRRVERTFLHLLLHCVFAHRFRADRMERTLWDLAADIAVEKVILDLGIPGAALSSDPDAEARLCALREECGTLTAEWIYRYFRANPPTPREQTEFRQLFARDLHDLWQSAERLEVTEAQWKKISERVRAEMKSFSRQRTDAESLELNLAETMREKFDYAAILRRFTVAGEDISVSEDEFDTIYYTYGLTHYGNLPLIEPLEYREATKVRDFVIAIDTSASCRGELVRAFLRKTYSILKSSESFFRRMNVHILQCDAEVRSDTRIGSDEDFERFLRGMRLAGGGSTDFRPVFAYVDKLREQGAFDRLKGLIYFTDGYGIYPEQIPDYDVVFAFLNEDENRAPVPPWSYRVILDSEELERQKGTDL